MNKEKTAAAFISIPKCASKSILTSFELGNCRDWNGNANTETHVLYENHQRLSVLEDLYDLNNISLSGTWSDPLAGLVLCSPMQTAYTICNGKIISEKGHLNNIDIGLFLEKHKAASKNLLEI